MTTRAEAMARLRGLAQVSQDMNETDKLYAAFKNAETRGLEGEDAFISTISIKQLLPQVLRDVRHEGM